MGRIRADLNRAAGAIHPARAGTSAGLPRRRQTQPVHLVAQSQARQPEFPGGSGDIALMAGQGLGQEPALQGIHPPAQAGGNALPKSGGHPGLADLWGQKVWGQNGTIGENQHALDLVLQLPDIAGPMVGGEAVQGFGGQPVHRAGPGRAAAWARMEPARAGMSWGRSLRAGSRRGTVARR